VSLRRGARGTRAGHGPRDGVAARGMAPGGGPHGVRDAAKAWRSIAAGPWPGGPATGPDGRRLRTRRGPWRGCDRRPSAGSPLLARGYDA
jgi:hypothetical protein